MSPTGEAPPDVAEAFSAAAITALQELAQVAAYPDFSGHDPAATFKGAAVVATIRLLRASPGTMSLILSAETAASLAARYLPAGTVLTDEIIDDVVGEFANVIAGQAKTALKGTAYHFHLSLPEVARGDNSLHRSAGIEPTANIQLHSEPGQILVQATLPPQT